MCNRKQITYRALDRDSGELRRGRIAPAARADVRVWLAQFAGYEAEFALEGTTGWRFVVEEIEPDLWLRSSPVRPKRSGTRARRPARRALPPRSTAGLARHSAWKRRRKHWTSISSCDRSRKRSTPPRGVLVLRVLIRPSPC